MTEQTPGRSPSQHDHRWEFRNGWHYCLVCGEPEAGMPTNYRAHQCASKPCACDLSLIAPARTSS